MTLTPQQAFIHIADAYRWLASADRSWQNLHQGELARGTAKRSEVNRLLPHVDVAIQGSALTYGRALIEFYAGTGGRSTDICAELFGIPFRYGDPDPSSNDGDLVYLVKVKEAIDKHLAHLTAHRDPEHRDRSGHVRPDWNDEIPVIVERLVSLLQKVAVDPRVKCQHAFAELLRVVQARRQQGLDEWPRPHGIKCI